MKRLYSTEQRNILFILSNGKCTQCKKPLDKKFHADHKLAFCRGGRTIITNGQALCPECNLRKGGSL